MLARSINARSAIVAIATSGLLLIVTVLAYSAWMRHVVVPDTFAYLPKESNLIVATGSIGSLWNGVDYHLGSVIRAEGTEPGFLADQVHDLQSSLNEALEDIPGFDEKEDRITRAASLTRHGFDISRGILLGAQIHGNDAEAIGEQASLLAVIPLRTDGRDDFRRFLSAFLGDKWTEDHNCNFENAPEAILMDAEPAVLVAFPESGPAVVSWAADPERSCQLLQQAFARDNLRHARGDDFLFAAARQQLARPLLDGAGAMIVLRAFPSDLSPVVKASAAIDFRPERMTGSIEVDFENDRARIVNEIFAPPPTAEPWRKAFPAGTGAIMVLRDTAIPRYFQFAALNEDIAKTLEDSFGGILGDLDEIDGIRQVVIAALDYEQGLPKLALAIWADEESLTELVTNVQRRLRDSRDRTILHGAISRFRRNATAADGQSAVPTLAALRSGTMCQDETWFDRFTIDANGELRAAELDGAAFGGAAYNTHGDGAELHFLDPEVTPNDFEFRLDLDRCSCEQAGSARPDDAAATEQVCSILLEGRYRLTAAIADGALWVTFGQRDIERILARKAAQSAGDDPAPSFTLGGDDDARRRKGGIYVNVPELVETGLLSGESDLQEAIEKYLFDLRDHPETSIALENVRQGERIRLTLEARKANLDQ